MDKIRAKLSSWKSKICSMIGRATLVSSILSSIPNFYIHAMWLRTSIHREIDRISRNFLWGSVDNQHKLHLINQVMICQPKNQRGLGFCSANKANIVAMAKLNWRIHTKYGKTWREVLVHKYNITLHTTSPPSSGLLAVKSIFKGASLFREGIKRLPSKWSNYFVLV